MKKKGLQIVMVEFLVLAVLFVLGGCGKSQGPVGPDSSGGDEASLRAFVEDNPDLFTFDFDDGSQASQNLSPDQALLKTIEPVAFWREITDRERDVEIQIFYPGGDSIPYAEMTITDYIQGLFHTVTMDSAYTKEIDDTAIRYAYFEKDSVGGPFEGWELKKVSGSEIASNPCTKEILSVHISSSSGLVDTTITDISDLWYLEDLFVFDLGDSVTLTVDTGNPDDVVFLHAPFFHRHPFKHIGGGVFEGTWVTAEEHISFRRPRHAAIDVIDHGTIFDDEMPYDSRAWGMVYYVGEGPDLE